jgi:hypothetical protein
MSKVNKDLDNMAGVEPRSYKKFSSIIMTKETIACLLYYCWLSFHSHESSLHKVFTWFLFFIIVDCHFIAMSPLCIRSLPDFVLYYCWLSFHSLEFSLHKVFTWFLLIVCFCFFNGSCLLVFSICFELFWWMGSHPWFFIYKVFLHRWWIWANFF